MRKCPFALFFRPFADLRLQSFALIYALLCSFGSFCVRLLLLCPEIGQFSAYPGESFLLSYTENLEKNGQIHWRSFKNPVEMAPRNCRLVVVECALTTVRTKMITVYFPDRFKLVILSATSAKN